MTPDDDQILADAKRASTLQLLFRCARRTNDLALARVAATVDGPPIRASHTALFPHIDLDGTRLTVLAGRVGITKQAVGQLVDDMVAHGTVEKVPNPTDGRARLVRFTPKGRAALLHGLALLQTLEDELQDALGTETWAGLRRAVLALDDHLDRV